MHWRLIYEIVGTTSTYHIRIRARVQASDFVKAEKRDNKQEKSEANELFSKEMNQPVSAKIDPGKDISKAYRLLREKKWRIAMIYMNHWEKDNIYIELQRLSAHFVRLLYVQKLLYENYKDFLF